MSEFASEQERFWAGDFGTDYISRNDDERRVRANEIVFERILSATEGVASVVEFGCNIGQNLVALRRIRPDAELHGYEINETAVARARENADLTIVQQTITEPLNPSRTFDLAFTKGVLIHIQPESLVDVYANLAACSHRYILVCEYYNPTPVMVPYRGHDDRLFKRDFAGELIDMLDLRLVDYGFVYHRDANAPLDDPTWFLLEKRAHESSAARDA